MSFDAALKVFDISAEDVADKKLVKDKYRQLQRQHHPDIGGDVEVAKQVNLAYEVLAKSKGTTRSKTNWDDINLKYKMAGARIKIDLLKNFRPDVFINYFSKASGGMNFAYEITETYPKDTDKSPSMAGFKAEFFTSDRSTLFSLGIHVSLMDVVYPKAEIGNGGDISYSIYTDAYGFHLNKKQKMSARTWGFTRDHSFFKQPEKLFPKAKLKAIFSGKTSKRKFMKRDMVTFLTKKLKATWDGEWSYIPLGDDYSLLVYRHTFMREGAWNMNGVYLKTGKYSHKKVSGHIRGSFMEEEETAKIFETIQKEAMKTKGAAKVKKVESLAKMAYEAYKKSKGL